MDSVYSPPWIVILYPRIIVAVTSSDDFFGTSGRAQDQRRLLGPTTNTICRGQMWIHRINDMLQCVQRIYTEGIRFTPRPTSTNNPRPDRISSHLVGTGCHRNPRWFPRAKSLPLRIRLSKDFFKDQKGLVLPSGAARFCNHWHGGGGNSNQ